jgi:paraquat-inducible protein B
LVFVKEPYTKFVNANTRFWNAGGIRVKFDAAGLKLDTQSLLSIIVGGVAFDNPPGGHAQAAPPRELAFNLFPDREAAMKNPETEAVRMVMIFEESVRGLALGAPVDFDGIIVGDVTAIDFDVDPKTGKIIIPVEVNLYPQRFRLHSRTRLADRTPVERKVLIDNLVAQGLRAQLRSANLLTGQLYVALDYFPHQRKASVDWTVSPPVVPTVRGNLQEIQAALLSVANKLDKLPLERISTGLDKTLGTANALLARLDSEVAPEARGALVEAQQALRSADRLLAPDQDLQQDVRGAVSDVGRAARALRSLADYLERHPEALLRGKPEDRK